LTESNTSYSNLIVSAYDFWHTRRRWLIALVALILAIAGVIVVRTPLTNDVKSLLPDNDAQFRRDFDLFSFAPFARNILISLELPDTGNDDSGQLLASAADEVIEALKPPFFTDAVSGISQAQKLEIFNWIYDHLPCLITESDIELLDELTTQSAIAVQMEENLRSLHSPESVLMKRLIIKDPLAIRRLLFSKLQQLSTVSGFSAESDYFLSQDGRHLLIIAETPIAMTDFGRSREMLGSLYDILDRLKPAGVSYRVVCGHLYTVANARTIQSDLWRVFAISISGLIVIFVIFLHHWRAMFVFLIPAAAVVTGIAATGLVFGEISAITIGFGAVLLGISADFGLHVFYGLRQSDVPKTQVIAELVKPLSYCAITTIGVFAMLLFSALPGQRQLAVFSISGILTALVLALFVMPHLMPASCTARLTRFSLPRARSFMLPVWIVIALAAVVPAMRVRFDSSLRNIGVMPKEALDDEAAIKEVWGSVRDRALVFCTGVSQEEAFRGNDAMLGHVKAAMPDIPVQSIAPIMPSRKSQEQNIARWNAFWNDSDRQDLLRTRLSEQGAQYGFAATAFEPFLNWLGRPAEVFAPEDFRSECSDKLIAPFLAELEDNRFAVLTFVPDDADVVARLENAGDNIQVVSNRKFNAQLNRETVRDFVRFFSGATAAIIVLLFVLFRNLKMIVLAFLPVLAGTLLMAAIMSLGGITINLFNMAAAILVIGLGVDYGIFVVCTRGKPHNAAVSNAVLVSGLTTFVGFGSLMVARHPAMNSIGVTVAAGIVPALLCALTLLPRLTELFLTEKK